jgi:hypothetical protein
MPRRNRRVRLSQGVGGLTDRQREFLLYGDWILCDPHAGDAFPSEDIARAAWNEFREELMAEAKHNRAGSRPWAFFHFDLKLDLRRGHDELAILLERGLVDKEEARRCERDDMMLSPDQAAGCYSALSSEELIGRLKFPPCILESMARQFELAAAWHTWRDRPEIAELYKNRSASVRGVLAGINQHEGVVQ